MEGLPVGHRRVTAHEMRARIRALARKKLIHAETPYARFPRAYRTGGRAEANGRLSARTLPELADELGISVAEILGIPPGRPPSPELEARAEEIGRVAAAIEGLGSDVEAGRRLGVADRSIRRWRTGFHRPRTWSLARVSVLTGIDPGWLADDPGPHAPDDALAAPARERRRAFAKLRTWCARHRHANRWA